MAPAFKFRAIPERFDMCLFFLTISRYEYLMAWVDFYPGKADLGVELDSLVQLPVNARPIRRARIAKAHAVPFSVRSGNLDE